MHGKRYCEILLLDLQEDGIYAEVFGEGVSPARACVEVADGAPVAWLMAALLVLSLYPLLFVESGFF